MTENVRKKLTRVLTDISVKCSLITTASSEPYDVDLLQVVCFNF